MLHDDAILRVVDLPPSVQDSVQNNSQFRQHNVNSRCFTHCAAQHACHEHMIRSALGLQAIANVIARQTHAMYITSGHRL